MRDGMKRFITISLVIVFICIGFSGCDLLDVINQLASNVYKSGETTVEIITEEYGVSSPEFNSCFNSLEPKQKEIYEKLSSVCEEMPIGYVKICDDYDKAVRDISIAYRAVLNDNTDIFWMPDTYIVSRKQTEDNKREVRIAFEYANSGSKTVKYPVTRKERDIMRNKLKEQVDFIVSQVKDLNNDLEKEKFFNDYICENTVYGTDQKFVNTSYGCLVDKTALCEGYSRAFKLLCNKVGVECDLIVGKAEGEGHMWNSVNIDGKHNYVDVTWNDRPDYKYLYFNITDEQLEYDHTLSPLYSEVTEKEVRSGSSYNFVRRECCYLGNIYYQVYGYILGDDFEDEYVDKACYYIKKDVSEGQNYTEFWLKNDKVKRMFLKNEEDFIKNIQNKLNDIRISSYIFKRDVLVLYFNE